MRRERDEDDGDAASRVEPAIRSAAMVAVFAAGGSSAFRNPRMSARLPCSERKATLDPASSALSPATSRSLCRNCEDRMVNDQLIIPFRTMKKGGPLPDRLSLCLAALESYPKTDYFSSTVAPASSSCFLILLGLDLVHAFLDGLRRALDESLFAFPSRPRRPGDGADFSLITLIFLPPSPVRMTSNSVFSSAAAPT